MHRPVPDFYYPQRCHDKTPRVIRHLQRLREQVAAMTEAERQANLQKQWIPTVADLDFLLNPSLRQRDRVEAIIVMHKRDMRGDSPTFPLIGEVLGVSKQSAQRFGDELVMHGRARHECRRFILNEGEYRHPMFQRLFLEACP
jgi:hypothetical protein